MIQWYTYRRLNRYILQQTFLIHPIQFVFIWFNILLKRSFILRIWKWFLQKEKKSWRDTQSAPIYGFVAEYC